MRLVVPALLGVVLSSGCGGPGGEADQGDSSGGSSSGGSSSGGSSSGGSSSGGGSSGGSSSGGSSSGGSSSGGSSSGGTQASTGGEGAGGGSGGDQGDACAPGWSDASSGLCWHLGVDGAMSFDNAKAYCQSLDGGLAGWRMPTIDELKAQIVGCDPVTDCEVSTTCVECPCGDDLDSCRPPSACAYLEGPGPAGCYWDNAFETGCTGGLNQEHYVWSSTAAVTPEGGASCSSEYWSVNFAEVGIAGIQDHFGMMVMCVK